MGLNDILCPVGMEAVEMILQNEKYKLQNMKFCEVKTPHFLVYLDQQNGRTTLSEYITEVYVKEKFRLFSKRDTLLEYELDGSVRQLNEIYADLKYRYSGYMNKYNGVVAISLEGLLRKNPREAEIPLFIKLMKEMKDDVTFVFFAPQNNTKSAELFSKIEKELVFVEKFTLSSYTVSQLSEIVKRVIEDKSVEIVGLETKYVIENLIMEEGITTAKAASFLGERLVKYANVRNRDVYLELNDNTLKKGLYKIGGK